MMQGSGENTELVYGDVCGIMRL